MYRYVWSGAAYGMLADIDPGMVINMHPYIQPTAIVRLTMGKVDFASGAHNKIFDDASIQYEIGKNFDFIETFHCEINWLGYSIPAGESIEDTTSALYEMLFV